MDQLKACMKKRSGILEPTRENVCNFINHPPPEGEGAKGDIRSLWSLVKSSFHKCRAHIHPGGLLPLTHEDEEEGFPLKKA